MAKTKRIRDYGISIGTMEPGSRNTITDVAGVRVGHVTLDQSGAKTGVTAVLPHPGNLFQEKVMAAAHVINGFGKTTGSIQITELGTIETPIILTNTLSVGLAADALIEHALRNNPDIGRTTGTVNPVVAECNDAYLNDIRGGHVRREHVWEAIAAADVVFAEGAVGAGTGMSCFQLKGGIGSASRLLRLGGQTYTVGVLVLSNFGRMEDLTIGSVPVGKIISGAAQDESDGGDKGSIITVVATDLPLSERQLQRGLKRVVVGLARTGSYLGHGSGDVVLGFTTANRISHYPDEAVLPLRMLHENGMDSFFRAVVESTEEAVLNSLICAKTTKGRDGHVRYSLQEYLHLIPGLLTP